MFFSNRKIGAKSFGRRLDFTAAEFQLLKKVIEVVGIVLKTLDWVIISLKQGWSFYATLDEITGWAFCSEPFTYTAFSQWGHG